MTQQPPSFPARRPPPTARNPKTAARFRRETWWQIVFPILLVTLVLAGGVAGLFALTGSQGTSVVADYSLILLSILGLIGGLIMLALIVALIYLISILLVRIPPYTYIAHQSVENIRDSILRVTGGITGFLISAIGVLSGITLFLKQHGLIPPTDEDSESKPSAGPSTAPGRADSGGAS